MIGYVTLGTNDLARAGEFYDALLGQLGAKRLMEFPTGIVWGTPGQPALSAMTPFDGNEATFGNGTMVGLAVASPEQVQQMHAKALELGARDEGAPGPRPSGFYCAYFRDLDGNKLNFFCPMVP
jgi:catechol 2,3-dioxygenase-like lactoylglutathione lyase family enzyme